MRTCSHNENMLLTVVFATYMGYVCITMVTLSPTDLPIQNSLVLTEILSKNFVVLGSIGSWNKKNIRNRFSLATFCVLFL